VISVNKSLVQQIETLRLRLQVDSRHHDALRDAMTQETHDRLKLKDSQLAELKDELRQRELAVSVMIMMMMMMMMMMMIMMMLMVMMTTMMMDDDDGDEGDDDDDCLPQ
jgi:hypothetical protein